MYYICLYFLLACTYILIPLHSRFLSEKRTRHLTSLLCSAVSISTFVLLQANTLVQATLLAHITTYQMGVISVSAVSSKQKYMVLTGQQNLHVPYLSSIICSLPQMQQDLPYLFPHCVPSALTALHWAARKDHRQAFLKLKVDYLIVIPYKDQK